MTRIRVDASSVRRRLERLDDIAPLLNMVARDFAEVVRDVDFRVHVETGDLKGSGRSSSTVVGDYWQGRITYGGTMGTQQFVDYAGFEKARGGDHDFMAPTSSFKPRVKALIVAHMRNG